MAVTDNSNQQAPQQQAAQPQQAQQQTQRPQQGQQQQQASASSLGSMFRRSGRTDGGDNRAAETLQILQRLKTESVENQDLEEDFQILRFDRDENRVGWSALLIVKTATINGKAVAAVRTIMMPNPTIKLPNRKIHYNNGFQQDVLEIEVEPRDVFSVSYWNRICDFLRTTSGKMDLQVRSAGAFPVPGEFDLKEEHVLKQVLIRSVNLCDDMLMRTSGETPFTVNMIKGADELLTASMDFSGTAQHDQLGNPVRSDIVVSLNRSKRGQETENEFYEADSTLNQVSLMVDLEYAQAPQQQMFGQQQMMPTQVCTPTVVITDVRNAPWIKANTMELHLFALSNAFRVTANQAWARAFLPEVGKVKDMRDIGALGWLSPVGKKIETKSETFTQQNFADLMFSMVKPNPVFCIDLDDMGDNSVIDSVWIDAMGGVNQSKAVATIVQAINNLIGRDFKEFFDYTTKPLVSTYGSSINKGYYFDGDVKRDRRDLDVLGALNAADGNQQEWMSWYAAMCNPNVHPELRNKQAKNFDRQYLGQVTYTSKATRAILNPEFIQGLDRAIAAVGLVITMDNIAMSFGAQRFQGNAGIADFAVTGHAQVASFMGNQPNLGQTYGSSVNGFYQ